MAWSLSASYVTANRIQNKRHEFRVLDQWDQLERKQEVEESRSNSALMKTFARFWKILSRRLRLIRRLLGFESRLCGKETTGEATRKMWKQLNAGQKPRATQHVHLLKEINTLHSPHPTRRTVVNHPLAAPLRRSPVAEPSVLQVFCLTTD